MPIKSTSIKTMDPVNDKTHVSGSDPEKIIVKDKIHRTPPKASGHISRSSLPDRSNRSRSNSVSVLRSSQRSDSVSLQVSDTGSTKAGGRNKRKKVTDSPETPVKDIDKSNTKCKNSTTCSVCSQNLDKSVNKIQCECCQNIYHAKCQNLTEKDIMAFEILGENASFFCLNCKAGAKVLFKGMQNLQNRMDSIDEDVTALKTKVDGIKSTQKSNSTKIKTLETTHATLRRDVDTTQNDIKEVQNKQKAHSEDNVRLNDQQKANSEALATVSTKLNTIEDDIVKKINSIIDTRVEEKVKNLKAEDIQIIPQEEISEAKLEKAVDKKIDEKLANKNDKLTETIETKIAESVVTTYNKNFPTIPSSDMEVDGDRAAKVKVPQTFATAVHMISREREEINRRKLQIVIINLKESDNLESDKKQAQDIFEIIKVNATITDVCRLGTLKPDKPDKPRLLRVSLENLAEKKNILAKATSLRSLPQDHKYANVYLKPNLTPQQQVDSKNLYLQLIAVKKKNPGKHYKISQGQIIHIPDPPTQ